MGRTRLGPDDGHRRRDVRTVVDPAGGHPASNRLPGGGRDLGLGVLLGGPPSGGVRGRQARDRAHQTRRPHLEEGGPGRGRGALGDGFVSTRDLAIDLGTANTLVYQPGRGVVFDEPTVAAVHNRTGEVLAVGRDAWRLVADSPGNAAVVR